MTWLRGAPAPGQVYITHGEPAAADAFRRTLRDRLGWNAVVAEDRQVVVVGAAVAGR